MGWAPPPRRSRALILILSGALGLRLAFALLMPGDAFLSIDGHEYRDIALNVAQGRGFAVSDYRWFEPRPAEAPALHPDLYRPPLLPLLGALLAKLPGDWIAWARLTAALLGTLLVFALHELGRILGGRRTGLWAAGLFAVYPYALFYSARWSTETLYALCLVSAVTSLARWRAGDGVRHAGWGGAALGLATLTRPVGLLQATGLLVGALLARSTPQRVKATAIYLATLLLILGPWMMRNQQQTGIANPGTFFGPYNLWLGANPRMYAMYSAGETPAFVAQMQALYSKDSRAHVDYMTAQGLTSEADTRVYWLEQVERFAAQQPRALREILRHRALHFLRIWPNRATSPPWHFWAALLSVGPLTLLALYALVRHRFPRDPLILCPPVLAWMGSLPFVFHLRFRFPAYDPFLVLLAAAGMVEIVRRLRPRGT